MLILWCFSIPQELVQFLHGTTPPNSARARMQIFYLLSTGMGTMDVDGSSGAWHILVGQPVECVLIALRPERIRQRTNGQVRPKIGGTSHNRLFQSLCRAAKMACVSAWRYSAVPKSLHSYMIITYPSPRHLGRSSTDIQYRTIQ